jgi:hypothetical protein
MNDQTVARPTEVVAESSPMPTETLEALRGSIRKWEAIVAGTGIDAGADNCDLCGQFNTFYLQGGKCTCFGCPVQTATGKHGCRGSPYEEYEDISSDDLDDADLDEKLKALARAELDFLKSLLPQEELPPHVERAIASEGGQGG